MFKSKMFEAGLVHRFGDLAAQTRKVIDAQKELKKKQEEEKKQSDFEEKSPSKIGDKETAEIIKNREKMTLKNPRKRRRRGRRSLISEDSLLGAGSSLG
jgi:hypothetical protein